MIRWSMSMHIPRWKHLGCYLWRGNMMGFLTVLLLGNCGWNKRGIKSDPLIPTTPSSTSLETWSHGKSRRKHHKGFFSLFFLVVQGRFLQQTYRYKRDENSNSADDSPRLLNALSSWRGIIMQIDVGVVSQIKSKIFFPPVGSKAKMSLWRKHQAVGRRDQAHAVPRNTSSWGFSQLNPEKEFSWTSAIRVGWIF